MTVHTRNFPTEIVLDHIARERERQIEKWGEQHHADGTGSRGYEVAAHQYKRSNDLIAAGDMIGSPERWDFILLEEVYEALSETDRLKLRTELVQVAAVATAWIEDLDSRGMY